MGYSQYYFPNASPPSTVTFPIAERPGSSNIGRRAGAIARLHSDISLETEEGVFWDYPRFRRRVWELTYRCTTEAHLSFFETLHLAADGHVTAFYFVPDASSPGTEFLVRKERDFLPGGIEAPTLDSSGNIIGIFDYVLRLEEESAAAQILA